VNRLLNREQFIPITSLPREYPAWKWLLTSWGMTFFMPDEEIPPLLDQCLFLMRRLQQPYSELLNMKREERLHFFKRELSLWKKEKADSEAL
jgi:hypothetical protein